MSTPPRRPIADQNAAKSDQAPEAHNQSQDDAGEQAQTLADEALGRGSDFGEGESEKPEYGGVSEHCDERRGSYESARDRPRHRWCNRAGNGAADRHGTKPSVRREGRAR